MPKRSDRELYGSIFDENPFEDFDAENMYRQLRWGKEPTETYTLNAPEPLATLGNLARLDLSFNRLIWKEKESPFLAVGQESNLLYIIPRDRKGYPVHIPIEGYEPGANIRRTDYIADKGGEECYFYHKHEPPYPKLLVHPTGVAIIIPSIYKRKRSYAVGKEGIVG